MTERQPRPSLRPGPLSSDQVEFYHVEGYLHLPGVFSADRVARFDVECERLLNENPDADDDNLRAQSRPSDHGGTAFDRFDPIIDISPVFEAAARDHALLALVGQLFDDEAFLFKDKLIFKRPGTHGYRVHQDYTYWCELPCPAEAMLSVLVAIDASDAEKGALEIIPRMHHAHLGPAEKPHDIFDPNSGLLSDSQIAGRDSVLPPLNAGDILVFHSLAPHRSGVNRASTSRRSLYFSYNAGKHGDLYETYYRNFHGYLRSDRSHRAERLHFR